MKDTSLLNGLLDCASHVFTQANQLGWAFQQEHKAQRRVCRIDLKGWNRHQPAFNGFCAAVIDLRDAMQNPPDGFAPVAQVLLKAAGIAKQIRDVMQTADGRARAAYLDFFPELNSIAVSGHEAIQDVTKAQRLDDPFAFVDQQDPTAASGNTAKATLDNNGEQKAECQVKVSLPHRLVAWREPRRDPLPELAKDQNRERQSRYCQGFDADWWLPALLAAKWCSDLYPRERTRESVKSWVAFTEQMQLEYVGPLAKPELAAELGANLQNDLALIQDFAPDLLELGNSDTESVEPASEKRRKRSTENGEGRVKLIAALTKHHQYADGCCLNLEPIGNNQLAKAARVSVSTSSAFFKDKFKGHSKYKALCRDSAGLIASLKLLNDEFAPHHLFGRRPKDEDERDDNGDE